MSLRNTNDRYGSLSIGAHWLMLLLLVAVYASMELRGLFPKGSETREAFKAWHFMLGLSVLILATMRLAMTLVGPLPSMESAAANWQKWSARGMHGALYLFMLGMPLLGWLMLSAEGKEIPFFGLQLPALASADKSLAQWAKDMHEAIANAGYFLVGLHAAAALFHHYALHDNTLTRMLPARK